MSQYEDITEAKGKLKDAQDRLISVRKVRKCKEQELCLHKCHTFVQIPQNLEDPFITLVEAHYVKLVDKLEVRLADACHDFGEDD